MQIKNSTADDHFLQVLQAKYSMIWLQSRLELEDWKEKRGQPRDLNILKCTLSHCTSSCFPHDENWGYNERPMNGRGLSQGHLNLSIEFVPLVIWPGNCRNLGHTESFNRNQPRGLEWIPHTSFKPRLLFLQESTDQEDSSPFHI